MNFCLYWFGWLLTEFLSNINFQPVRCKQVEKLNKALKLRIIVLYRFLDDVFGLPPLYILCFEFHNEFKSLSVTKHIDTATFRADMIFSELRYPILFFYRLSFLIHIKHEEKQLLGALNLMTLLKKINLQFHSNRQAR